MYSAHKTLQNQYFIAQPMDLRNSARPSVFNTHDGGVIITRGLTISPASPRPTTPPPVEPQSKPPPNHESMFIHPDTPARPPPYANVNDHTILRILAAIKRSFTHNLDEWCELTPWHCVINVHRAKRIVFKAMWLSLVVFSSFLAVYQCGMLIADFLGESQWVTSVTYEMPEGGGLEWPNMSACNLNEDFASKFRKENLTDPYEIAMVKTMTIEGVRFYKDYQALDGEPAASENISIIEEKYRVSSAHNYSVTELLNKMIKGCDDTVVHCGLSSKFRLHDNHPACCSGSKIRWRSCFSMHPTDTFGRNQINVRSEDSGIFYLFDPNVGDSYDRLVLFNKPSAGLRLQMYFGTLEASTPETILLSPGTHTVISLVPQKNKISYQASEILPFYESKKYCLENPFYEYKFVAGNPYSQALCQTDCAVDWEIHMCQGCTLKTVRQKENRECRGNQIRRCFDFGSDTTNLNKTFPDGFNYLKCSGECAEACEHRSVATKTTQSQFPATPKVEALVTYLNRALPNASAHPFDQKVVKQMILLEITYQTMEYEVVTKMQRTTIGQVVSDIGGALGVWTGLSILSMFQAVTYMSLFFFQLCKQLVLLCWRRD